MSSFDRCRPVAAGLACLWLFATCAAAAAQIDILSGQPFSPQSGGLSQGVGGPESVVSVSAEVLVTAGRPAMLSVTADIAPPWHAYAITQKPIQAIPTTITVESSPDYRVVGEFRPKLPPQVELRDGLMFEEHSGTVTWQAPLEVRAGVDVRNLKVSGKARIQVCSDRSCLSPTSFPFTALAVSAEPAPVAGSQVKGVYTHPNIHAAIHGQLEPQAVVPGSTVKLVLTADPVKGWHVYELTARDPGDLGYKPTLIVLINTSGFRA